MLSGAWSCGKARASPAPRMRSRHTSLVGSALDGVQSGRRPARCGRALECLSCSSFAQGASGGLPSAAATPLGGSPVGSIYPLQEHPALGAANASDPPPGEQSSAARLAVLVSALAAAAFLPSRHVRLRVVRANHLPGGPRLHLRTAQRWAAAAGRRRRSAAWTAPAAARPAARASWARAAPPRSSRWGAAARRCCRRRPRSRSWPASSRSGMTCGRTCWRCR